MTNLLDNYISNPPVRIEATDTGNAARRKKIVTAASIAGSALGIAAATYGIYSAAKKGNPGLKFNNLTYEEKDALLIGAASVAGGLTGGIIADNKKENLNLKLREASQQFIGNMVFPIGILAGVNRILDSANISNIAVKGIATIAAIIGGMHLGNEVMNKVNDGLFKEKIKHDVKPEDYFVHVDDIALTANMLLKDIPSITPITSKLLPASFIIAGSKSGMAGKE